MYNSCVTVIPRLLGEALLRTEAKVVVLEGARAVGKTTLVRTVLQERGFSYASLSDPAVLNRAARDPDGWLRGLSLPAVIDEAQLLETLPLLVKDLVDETPGSGTRVVLTGSSSIGRTGLGGADPLTRRSRRFTMGPLTEWEIAGKKDSLVDLLFDADIVLGGRTKSDEAELVRSVSRGGFPSYVVPNTVRTRRDLWRDLRSDVEGLLSDEALAGRGIDTLAARSALDLLLRTPGGIFNASRLAQQLDLDRRTVDRYLSIFERVFLLHHLPNLATAASRQNHSRAKIHPVDTSFAVESLARAGVELPDDREAFGAVLESHVVNQLTTAIAWSDHEVRAFYWRSAAQKGHEVDLVLIDERDRAVGIEVKTSRSVHERDINGILALADQRGLHRGFVFYGGAETIRLRENIWAVPLSALTGSHVIGAINSSTIPNRENSAAPTSAARTDASMFVSYVHADDQSSRGRILDFARDLADRYEFLTGRTLRLFIDRDDITWRENWSRRLTHKTGSTSFLLGFITPRYLSSDACRSEFLAFGQAASTDPGQKILLPLVWVDPSSSGVVSDQDVVWSRVRETQSESAVDVRLLEPGSVAYDALLDRVAGRLRQAVDAVDPESSAALNGGGDGGAAPDEHDVLEIMESMQSKQSHFGASAREFKDALQDVSNVFSRRPPLAAASADVDARALAEIGAELAEPVARLDHATDNLGAIWSGMDSDISRIVLLMSSMPNPPQRRSLSETLDALVQTLEVPGAPLLELQLSDLGDLSRHLRPMSRSLASGVRLVKGIQTSARSWRDMVMHLPG
ncbi:hypothetical protein C5E08_12895 [Rathayibacter iranicus]|uniref:DUF4143 domain-containing protein n=2 Tax=Rathayibacter iranicus TaxID=59737 RepID=A0AAD1AE87_9MICO|nr:AAA family ATPase [Rathayibacter iranicus]AZZ56702.1 DUF4143 domain-containing protein [Rathayibacter iranicus]MWV31258.1 DUF4143 domain-containing protein [Rathayibacter iranicus NCPPB 2253 = VKM Ac-1602]PPI43171.1 hypothetical protein C5E09_11985 [Rathayibacter iranicus]PPI58291.1 hypothetical protein C5E08_12895 [Rathayibacter iranicus]PPI69299.1 hypothetical protein C5E01_11940 [Rathayibacter iranicus]